MTVQVGTRVDDVIVALVALLGPAVTPVPVYDGPALTGDDRPLAVYVGWDGDDEGEGLAVTDWTQTWAGLGARAKDETFGVVCSVVAWSGDTDVPPKRLTALAAFAQIETALRGQVDLARPSPTITGVRSGQLFQQQTTTGLLVRVPFVVGVQTRI